MVKHPPRIFFTMAFVAVLLFVGIYIAFVTEPKFQEKVLTPDFFYDENSTFSDKEKSSTNEIKLQQNFGEFVTQILNGEYEINSVESYQFHNGAYYFKYGPCKENCEPLSNYPDSNYTVVIDKNNIATGDLDSDGMEDAVVILGKRYGGTGYFVSVAFFRNTDGKPTFVTLRDLGDRTIVKSVEIRNGFLELKLLTHDSGEPMCCANTPKTIVYEFVEGTLLEKSDKI